MNLPSKFSLGLLLTLTLWMDGSPARAEEAVLITEIMAANDRTVLGDLGEFSDWIEIYNNGTDPVNLKGYALTDEPGNLSKWQFPATNLPPQKYLVVYASGLDRVTLGLPLHTNFKLSADGEYLALVRADGYTLASEFAPVFPATSEGLSYGVAVEDLKTVSPVPTGAETRFLIPPASIGDAWVKPEFDDAAWSKGKAPLKFDLNAGPYSYDNFAGTDIEADMIGKNSTAYIRIPFGGIDAAQINDVQLQLKYDDGVVVWLNGQEIARRSAPLALAWNSAAVSARSNVLALVTERISLNDVRSLLRTSGNVLAIQGLNRTPGEADFLIAPEIVARQIKVLTNVYRFFDAPTPGGANIPGLPGRAGEVRFSRKTATFVDPFQLTLEAVDAAPGATIRYTVDRTAPTLASPAYTTPLNVSTSILVRAQVYAPGLFPGPVQSESFMVLSSNVVNVTSDLPIMVIHSFGGGRLNGNLYAPAIITIHEPVRGRSALTNAPHATARAGFKDRGSSTAGQVKANYAVEIWDEENRPKDISILGMPADADWVFHAPYNWDPSLFRNPLAYAMGHRTGRYASRYRFVEVYINSVAGSGPISSTSYAGVYNILEKVKAGKDRIDIDTLTAGDLAPPEVTGGYIMKIDRLDPSDRGLNAGGRQIAMVEPKEAELFAADRAPQRKYLTDFLNGFNQALAGANSAHPTLGYAPYIDSAAWIDFHIVDTITWNVDALRLSSYFHKPRNGPMVYGPLWDYDRSLGSTDGRDTNPRVWGSGFFTEAWWSRLYRDTNFWQLWVDRWQDLRQNPLSNKAVLSLIDSLAAEVQEAAPRDFAKWRQPKRGGNQAGEVNHLKNWLMSRLEFMDTNLLQRPTFSRAGGQAFPGLALTITARPGSTVYYTLDGSDPRLPGGAVSPLALAYSGPVALTRAAQVKARALNLTHRNLTGGENPPVSTPWSGLTQAKFSTFAPAVAGKLILTEIHYHPAQPSARELGANPAFQSDDFEFVELKNISGEPLDLHGVTFKQGIEFTFGDGATDSIRPGQTVVIGKNRSAFQARYGAQLNLGGEFKGNLDNNGERIELADADGRTITDIEYRSAWHPITDGHGFSLVQADENREPANADVKTAWRPSALASGSPAKPDPAGPALPAVVINEVLAYGDKKDAIELHNPTAALANIGGWFLTDDFNAPKKFRIPEGTTIASGGFKVFDEDDFNPGGGRPGSFSFSRFGDQVYLFAADSAGNLLPYSHGFSFEGADKDVTFGRVVASTGEEHFVPQITGTLKAANSGPKAGPVVINEIMYHPRDVFVNGQYWDDDENEFIELHNFTGQPVALFDPTHPANTWALRGGVDFEFPSNQVISSQGYLLIVNFDPSANPAQLAAFRAKYAAGSGVRILGPYQGRLANAAGSLKLFKPGEPDPADATNSARAPRILVDVVDYSDDGAWPAAADGLGHSLQRTANVQFGNDASNWKAIPPTPGSVNGRLDPPQITRQPSGSIVVAGSSATMTVAAGGTGPVSYHWRFRGQNISSATNATLVLSQVTSEQAGDYQAVILNSAGAVSSAPARLTVLDPPKIVLPPTGQNVSPGGAATLAVSVKSSGSVSYQWMFNGTNLPGAINSTLVLTNMQLAQSGAYSVMVSDLIGVSRSEPALVNVLVKPEIIAQTFNQTALEGDTVVMSVTATGTTPFTYRWRKDGANLTGGTNAMLVLTNVTLADAGLYGVIVTNIASARIPTLSQDVSLFVFADFDRDRMADLWEAANGFATNNLSDALLDPDGDGMSNQQEYLAGTNPRDKQDVFKIESVKVGAESAEIRFLARTNKTYTLQFKEALTSPSWMSLTNVLDPPTNRIETILDRSTRKRDRFYRLVTPAIP